MAPPRRRPDPPLVETLFEEPFRFDFFQAVRLLHRLDPDRVAIGRDGPPRREVARFVARLSLNFPPSSIHELERPAEPEAPPRDDRRVHGPDRPVGGPPALLHQAAHGAAQGGGPDPRGLPRPAQPPPGLALLPRLGEVPRHRPLRAGRGRPLLALGLPPDRPGDARPSRSARLPRRGLALLRRPLRPEAPPRRGPRGRLARRLRAAGGGPAVRRAMAPARAGRPLDPGHVRAAQSAGGQHGPGRPRLGRAGQVPAPRRAADVRPLPRAPARRRRRSARWPRWRDCSSTPSSISTSSSS